eukprot:4418246-Pleurochrysis_carterae.AAC.3
MDYMQVTVCKHCHAIDKSLIPSSPLENEGGLMATKSFHVDIRSAKNLSPPETPRLTNLGYSRQFTFHSHRSDELGMLWPFDDLGPLRLSGELGSLPLQMR